MLFWVFYSPWQDLVGDSQKRFSFRGKQGEAQVGRGGGRGKSLVAKTSPVRSWIRQSQTVTHLNF